MVLPIKWLLLAPFFVASVATAQPQLPARQRQDRRVALPTTSADPVPELYVAAGNLTTTAFNAKLDPDSLVVDKTRFKWAQVSDNFLLLEPFADLSSNDKLIVQIGFKDKALPAKAIIAVTSKADVVDGNVEMDRRANTPEALLAALTQKEAELEELKARYAGNGPASLVLSEWLTEETGPVRLNVEAATADASGLMVRRAAGYEGQFSALVAIRVLNLHGHKSWVPAQASITSATGTPVKVISVQMRFEELPPGKEGLVVVETRTPPWTAGKFKVALVDGSSSRHLSFDLWTR